jgi:arylsulfatase A-like enzyme
MKAIMLMFDSLNRHFLPNYGCEWTHAPNFKRLGEKTVTFDNSYVGSMPCIPARRELHTGRYNFLHRSWGPLEPFDDSMPEILKTNGIYSHLVTDHIHYFEDGGCTYHTRYSSWEVSRGQEGDTWKGIVDGYRSSTIGGMSIVNNLRRQDAINRKYLTDEKDMPQAITFRNGLEFIDTNHKADNWFLQIETFDPHEPFFSSEKFKQMYQDPDYIGEDLDWPPYAPTEGFSKEEIQHCRKRYASLVSMCDYYVGQLLDTMDRYDLWKDTMLIVNTDHGFLLGEHGWWAKSVMPYYNEIANTPLFIWDPRFKIKNERRKSLVQTIDMPATILEYFNQELPDDIQGKPLNGVIQNDTPVRETALFGCHGQMVNVTDGRYVYMRNSIDEDSEIYEYTLMPTHMRYRFTTKELQNIALSDPFKFTKSCRLMKIKTENKGISSQYRFGNKLYDLQNDPGELCEIDDIDTEVRLTNEIQKLLKENDAPEELFIRLGIPKDEPYTAEMLLKQRQIRKTIETVDFLKGHECSRSAYYEISGIMSLMSDKECRSFKVQLCEAIDARGQNTIDSKFVKKFVEGLDLEEKMKDSVSDIMKYYQKV